jgi:hypothetical protein
VKITSIDPNLSTFDVGFNCILQVALTSLLTDHLARQFFKRSGVRKGLTSRDFAVRLCRLPQKCLRIAKSRNCSYCRPGFGP